MLEILQIKVNVRFEYLNRINDTYERFVTLTFCFWGHVYCSRGLRPLSVLGNLGLKSLCPKWTFYLINMLQILQSILHFRFQCLNSINDTWWRYVTHPFALGAMCIAWETLNWHQFRAILTQNHYFWSEHSTSLICRRFYKVRWMSGFCFWIQSMIHNKGVSHIIFAVGVMCIAWKALVWHQFRAI